MSWNFSNDVPIYLQIMEHFKVQIASGKLAVGDKIPPVRELALEAGVNPNTMQKAYQSLKEKAILNHREHLEG
jgi:GntR family transcriptional regulator